MDSHHTTTFGRIVNLYDAERQLLDKAGDDFLTPDEQDRLKGIRQMLEQLWPKEREERVFAIHGPPRLISDNRPMSHTKAIAYGMAPLPSGGD